MIQITIDNFVNGYSARLFDGHKYLVNEICETKTEAVNAIIRALKQLETIKFEVI